jgi:hypothetical protein
VCVKPLGSLGRLFPLHFNCASMILSQDASAVTVSSPTDRALGGESAGRFHGIVIEARTPTVIRGRFTLLDQGAPGGAGAGAMRLNLSRPL